MPAAFKAWKSFLGVICDFIYPWLKCESLGFCVHVCVFIFSANGQHSTTHCRIRKILAGRSHLYRKNPEFIFCLQCVVKFFQNLLKNLNMSVHQAFKSTWFEAICSNKYLPMLAIPHLWQLLVLFFPQRILVCLSTGL